MKKLVHDIVVVGLVGSLALFVSGCEGKYTGGGVIDSAIEEGAKANLGFNMHATDTDSECIELLGVEICNIADEVKGQLQYKDHGSDDIKYPKGLSIHGVVTGGGVFEGILSRSGELTGTYTPQPKKLGDGGTFIATVYDNGEPGASEDDSFTIELKDGVYDGYTNSGFLNGGNIKYHEPK